MFDQQPSPAQTVESLKKELVEALATRAQADEKIKAIQNVLQGAALGVELQKAVEAEQKASAETPAQ